MVSSYIYVIACAQKLTRWST